jgi:diguanylate cyclase (GGDEF)-like protein
LLLEGPELRVVEADRSALNLLARQRPALLGQPISSVLDFRHAAHPAAIARLLKHRAGQLTMAVRLRGADGRWLRTSLSLSPIAANCALLLGMVRDPARSRGPRRSCPAMSSDALTGLASRDVLEARLAAAHEEVCSGARPLAAVLFIDLDGFKQINDAHGHLVGDDVLRIVARRLLSAVRPDDLAARFGGDEFVVLLDDVHSETEVRQIARRIGRKLQSGIQCGRRRVAVSASIGVKIISQRDKSPRALLAAADKAMYRAKGLGGGRDVVVSR